jgi:hypothetical protein
MLAGLPSRPASIARRYMFDHYLEAAVLPNGFEIRCLPGELANVRRRQRVYAALELINSLDPLRLRRIQRDILYMAVIDGSRSYYWPNGKTIVLGSSDVDRSSPGMLASTIIHEGIHSRLHSGGFAYFPDAIRNRMESICVRAQLSFTKKLSHRDYPGMSRSIYYIVHRLRVGSWSFD